MGCGAKLAGNPQTHMDPLGAGNKKSDILSEFLDCLFVPLDAAFSLGCKKCAFDNESSLLDMGMLQPEVFAAIFQSSTAR